MRSHRNPPCPRRSSGKRPRPGCWSTNCCQGKSSSPEDVILSELLWHRAAPALERQFQDVVEVYEIQDPCLEQDYLEQWARELGVGDLLERVKQEAAQPPDA